MEQPKNIKLLVIETSGNGENALACALHFPQEPTMHPVYDFEEQVA